MQVIWNGLSPIKYQYTQKSNRQAKNTQTSANTNSKGILEAYLKNKANMNALNVQNFGSQAISERDRVLSFYKELKPNIIPDKYQIQAAEAIERGDSVMVVAPTGTGKTLIGEYASAKNLKNNDTTFYTTPLKALTNQKYGDFSKEFEAQNVGILTGDIKYNVTAPIKVMTTEIYRNMLDLDQKKNENMPNKPTTVTLDEFHYMNDLDRGSTWEEAIMLSPSDTQLLALSATIGNSDKLKEWMEKINPAKKVTLIEVSPKERHVPLKFYKFDQKGMEPMFSDSIDLKELSMTLNKEDTPDRTNQILTELAQIFYPEKENTPNDGMKALLELYHYDINRKVETDDLIQKLQQKYVDSENAEKIALSLANQKIPTVKEVTPYPDKKGEKGINSDAVNALLDNLHGLKKSDQSKMPAIVFVFSKKDCERLADEYSNHITNTREKLDSKKVKKKKQAEFAQLSRQEKKERREKINQKINEYQKSGIVLGTEFDNTTRQRLYNGVAVHNAGMLPGHKRLIEELFQERLIDVVFSTETLAAGINMPAKTTVLTSLDKPAGLENGEITRRPLNANEFQQMTGRAGRRGIDNVGNVVVMTENQKDLQRAQQLTTAKPDDIQSKLDVSYSLLINFLEKNNGEFSYEMANDYLDRSFLIFNSDNPEQVKAKNIEKLEKLKDIMEQAGFLQKQTDGSYSTSLKAELVPKVKGTNELFLAEAIADGTFFNLSPTELIEAAGSLVNENKKPDFANQNSKSTDSQKEEAENPMLDSAFEQMDRSKAGINALQLEHLGVDSVENEIKIDRNYAKYLSKWAQPSDDNEKQWSSIINDMHKKELIKFEGDFFKSVNSTINLLNQIDTLSQEAASLSADEKEKYYYLDVSKNAKKAVELLSKSPIRDDVMNFA